MRINLRGGVWKNSEDEVLKAAVMKYGLNNWARVASLLSRKTARQCKARWAEWIDPSVKKTEWTLEEEERLLHLAKVFPSQWRTIATMVGRTAHQCLTHYEKLLDIAQGRTGELADDDPRKLRPGDIDPAPETKPSRADAVDMDDDEIEMLAEARARLANTRGKKAKRKAREKQMEAAKRLAQLQKKRELKAAGIGVSYGHSKKDKGDMYDHSVDLAFERKPSGGPFDSIQENPQFTQTQKNVSLQEIEGVRRDAERKKLQDQDRRRLKKLKEDNLPEALKIIEEMNNPLRKKKFTALVLPEPELAEEDVLDIVKIGQKGGQFNNALDLSVDATNATKPLEPAQMLLEEKRQLTDQLMEASMMQSGRIVPDKGLQEEEEYVQRQKRQREWEMLQSKPVQMKLPRPVYFDQVGFKQIMDPKKASVLAEAESVILNEMKTLVAHDCVTHPMAKGLAPNLFDVPPLVEDLTRDQLDAAEHDIAVATVRVMQHTEKAKCTTTSGEIQLETILSELENLQTSPELTDLKLISMLKQQEADIKRLSKYKTRYTKMTKGYIELLTSLRKERAQLTYDIADKQRNLDALIMISQQEGEALKKRIEEGRHACDEARMEYNSLQDIAMDMDSGTLQA